MQLGLRFVQSSHSGGVDSSWFISSSMGSLGLKGRQVEESKAKKDPKDSKSTFIWLHSWDTSHSFRSTSHYIRVIWIGRLHFERKSQEILPWSHRRQTWTCSTSLSGSIIPSLFQICSTSSSVNWPIFFKCSRCSRNSLFCLAIVSSIRLLCSWSAKHNSWNTTCFLYVKLYSYFLYNWCSLK